MERELRPRDAKSFAGATVNVALKSVRFAFNAKVSDRHKIRQSASLPKLMKPRCFRVSPAPIPNTASTISRRKQLNANKKRIARQFSASMDAMGYFCFNAGQTNACNHEIIAIKNNPMIEHCECRYAASPYDGMRDTLLCTCLFLG